MAIVDKMGLAAGMASIVIDYFCRKPPKISRKTRRAQSCSGGDDSRMEVYGGAEPFIFASFSVLVLGSIALAFCGLRILAT